MNNLLQITHLNTCFPTPGGMLHAVKDVTLTIDKGKTVALVGESGSGKSMTALSVMRLVPPPGRIVSGSITFQGSELLEMSAADMRTIRGRHIGMIFQDPMTSLNPVLRIGEQVQEPMMLHLGMSKEDASAKAAQLLKSVGIPSAENRLRDYPHQLSGGMRQRVMIAMALACDPDLLIADEPTTALDVTIQAQILELIDSLRSSSQMGIILITHDLGIVAERSDITCVMYAGCIVESAPSLTLLKAPAHPYTRALLNSLPQNAEPGKPLSTLGGQLTPQDCRSAGCSFQPRCPVALPQCSSQMPQLKEINPGHLVRCWNCR